MKGYKNVFLVLFLTGVAFSLAAQDSGISLASVEFEIRGITRQSALSKYLELESGLEFDDEEGLRRYAEDLERRLINNRVFDPESFVDYRIEMDPDGRRKAYITVHAKDTISAVAIPLPKYSSSDGFSLAIRYKDYNFLGFLEPFTLNLDWFASTGKLDVGVEGALPFRAFGGDWSAGVDIGLVFPRDSDPVPDITLTLGGSYVWGFKGREWFLTPSLSYDYDPDDGSQTGTAGATFGLRYDWGLPWTLSTGSTLTIDHLAYSTASITNTVGLSTSIVLVRLGFLGDLVLSPSTSLYGTITLPEVSVSETGWTASGTISTGRVDWTGNFRKGASFRTTGSFTKRLLFASPEDAWDGSVSLDMSGFISWANIVGINARILGRWYLDWTLLGDFNTDFDWEDVFRGRAATLYGDLGAVLNLELPLNIAQGKFFDADKLEAEVFLVPFLDLGFVRTDPAQPLDFERFGMAFAGCEFVVYPTRARAFAYRLSLGYDALDFLRTKDFSAGKLEIFLGLGTLF